jgi:hypothetical protein
MLNRSGGLNPFNNNQPSTNFMAKLENTKDVYPLITENRANNIHLLAIAQKKINELIPAESRKDKSSINEIFYKMSSGSVALNDKQIKAIAFEYLELKAQLDLSFKNNNNLIELKDGKKINRMDPEADYEFLKWYKDKPETEKQAIAGEILKIEQALCADKKSIDRVSKNLELAEALTPKGYFKNLQQEVENNINSTRRSLGKLIGRKPVILPPPKFNLSTPENYKKISGKFPNLDPLAIPEVIRNFFHLDTSFSPEAEAIYLKAIDSDLEINLKEDDSLYVYDQKIEDLNEIFSYASETEHYPATSLKLKQNKLKLLSEMDSLHKHLENTYGSNLEKGLDLLDKLPKLISSEQIAQRLKTIYNENLIPTTLKPTLKEMLIKNSQILVDLHLKHSNVIPKAKHIKVIKDILSLDNQVDILEDIYFADSKYSANLRAKLKEYGMNSFNKTDLHNLILEGNKLKPKYLEGRKDTDIAEYQRIKKLVSTSEKLQIIAQTALIDNLSVIESRLTESNNPSLRNYTYFRPEKNFMIKMLSY